MGDTVILNAVLVFSRGNRPPRTVTNSKSANGTPTVSGGRRIMEITA